MSSCENIEDVTQHEKELIHQHITWFGHGGLDMWGEWVYAGSDYTDIYKEFSGLKFNYHVELHIKRDAKYNQKPRAYFVTITLKDYLSGNYKVGWSKQLKSRKAANLEVERIILEFEKSKCFEEEIWKQVIAKNRLSLIVKKFDDEDYRWIATTWDSGWSLIANKTEIQKYSRNNWIFAVGEFWIYSLSKNWRDPKWSWSKITNGSSFSSSEHCENLPFIPEEVIGKGIERLRNEL